MEQENKYVIKNVKYNVYYNKMVADNVFHFVKNLKEAKIFKNEEDARKVLQEVFNNNEKYKIEQC